MLAPYDPSAVANFFLHKDRFTSLTQLKLHKILYFAHGWYLGLTGKPLLTEKFSAWRFGPVIPNLYHEFREFGADPICRLAFPTGLGLRRKPKGLQVDVSDDYERAFLERVWVVYGEYTAAQLVHLTHAADQPWAITREKNPNDPTASISNDLIRKKFKERIKASRHGT